MRSHLIPYIKACQNTSPEDSSSYAHFSRFFLCILHLSTRKRDTSIGCMYFVGPSGGERFFLRTLLTVVKGARSYEDLRSVDGNVYETFKDACVAHGLYESDDEWHQCLTEASVMQIGS